MGAKENKLIKEHLREMDPETQRRFRINAFGISWKGKEIRGELIRGYINKCGTKNCLLLVGPRVINGAPEGFPDTIGWDTVEITHDMVGKKIAVFVGEEYKTGKLGLSKAQQKFKAVLDRMGGIFRVVRG